MVSAEIWYLMFFNLHTDPVWSVVSSLTTLCSSSSQTKYILRIQQKTGRNMDILGVVTLTPPSPSAKVTS